MEEAFWQCSKISTSHTGDCVTRTTTKQYTKWSFLYCMERVEVAWYVPLLNVAQNFILCGKRGGQISYICTLVCVTVAVCSMRV